MELLIVIIVLSLLFDYINGFHDAANSIATIVSTRVLTPYTYGSSQNFYTETLTFVERAITSGTSRN